MILSGDRRAALRFGSAALVLAAVILSVFAFTIDSGPTTAADLEQVPDGTEIVLPRLGLFGGSVTVYGTTDRPAPTAADLGCSLLSESGSRQSSAKISDLRVLGRPDVSRDGVDLVPLFEVGHYPSGSRVVCETASNVTPLFVSAPRTFGGLGLLVRVFAATSAVLCLVVAAIGLLLTRRRGPASA